MVCIFVTHLLSSAILSCTESKKKLLSWLRLLPESPQLLNKLVLKMAVWSGLFMKLTKPMVAYQAYHRLGWQSQSRECLDFGANRGSL